MYDGLRLSHVRRDVRTGSVSGVVDGAVDPPNPRLMYFQATRSSPPWELQLPFPVRSQLPDRNTARSLSPSAST